MKNEKNNLLSKAKNLNQQEKFSEVVTLLDDDLLEKYNDDNLYAEKALAYFKISNLTLCEVNSLKSLEINPNNPIANNYYANVLSRRDEFDKAQGYYLKAIKFNPKYFGYSYNLALNYYRIGKYDNAKEEVLKAIKLNPNYARSSHLLGLIYHALKDKKNAEKYYSKAIDLNVQNSSVYYNRGLIYFELDEYKKSLTDFEKYIKVKTGSDFFTENAKSRIIELKKLIKSEEYSAINDVVNKIKELLQYEDGCVTHYTSFSVAKNLILNNESLFRLSEGSFLNDTSEGSELFNFLEFPQSIQKRKETKVEKFSQKPFIGSFVAEVKHDDLTLWRMYGKEQKEEAKGCALTIDMNKLLEDLNKKMIPNYNDDETSNSKSVEEFCFYRVVYKKQDSSEQFLIPDTMPQVQSDLNNLMKELKEKTSHFKKKRKGVEEKQNLIKLLNEISYLFKSDEYQYENEVRLVVKGVGFEKNIKEEELKPKVYIELVSIRPLVRKITLGPKVDRADEWAAAFYYNLEKDNYNPEILISHLPFK